MSVLAISYVIIWKEKNLHNFAVLLIILENNFISLKKCEEFDINYGKIRWDLLFLLMILIKVIIIINCHLIFIENVGRLS